jgi:hypothetical protein
LVSFAPWLANCINFIDDDDKEVTLRAMLFPSVLGVPEMRAKVLLRLS